MFYSGAVDIMGRANELRPRRGVPFPVVEAQTDSGDSHGPPKIPPGLFAETKPSASSRQLLEEAHGKNVSAWPRSAPRHH